MIKEPFRKKMVVDNLYRACIYVEIPTFIIFQCIALYRIALYVNASQDHRALPSKKMPDRSWE